MVSPQLVTKSALEGMETSFMYRLMQLNKSVEAENTALKDRVEALENRQELMITFQILMFVLIVFCIVPLFY
jgi:uncharacterized protein YfcZ (UPF0381/DUF406 family)